MLFRLRVALCFWLVAMTALTLFGQDKIEPPEPVVNLPTSATDIDQGKRLYELHCASCHGPRGEGSKGPTLAQPTLPRATDDTALMRIIQRGIEGSEMPRSRLERADAARVAAFVKSLGALPPESVPGNPARGQVLYFGKAQCAACHTLNGRGSAFCGELDDIGRRRSAAYLRRALLEPNAELPQSFSARNESGLPQNYLYVRAVTRDRREISGTRVNEDTFMIMIREAPGRVHSFFKSDLRELRKEHGKSPMPSYAGALTADEIDDLVAFMVSLRGKK